MENQKELLTEAKYQEVNKAIKIVGIVVLLVGLGMIGFGVYNLIGAGSMDVPKMGDPEWFDKSSSQSEQQFLGTALCMFGVFVSVVGCLIRFVIPNRRAIVAYQAQQMRPVVEEGIQKVAPAAGVAAKEIAKGVKEGLKDSDK